MLSSHRHTLVDDSHGQVTLMPWLGASKDERTRAFGGNQTLAIVERWRRKGGRRGLVQVASWLAADRGELRGLSEEALAEQIRKAVRAHRLIALPGVVEAKKRVRAPLVPVVEEVVLPKVAPRREATADDAEPTIRLVNLESRYFVPGRETVRISYAIDGPVEKAASVKLVVKSLPGGDQGAGVVGRVKVEGPYEGMGEMHWDGHLSKEEMIRLAFSPYELWFELTSKSGHRSESNRTEVELEIHSIDIRVDDIGVLDVADNHRAAVKALSAELEKNGMPGDCQGRVVIESPVFQLMSEEDEDVTRASTLSYQDEVGDGVEVPLLATVKLKSKAGGGRRAPAALRDTQVLWTFSYDNREQFAESLRQRHVGERQQSFLKAVIGYQAEQTQPPGMAAHHKIGGRRGLPVGEGEGKVTYWRLTAERRSPRPPDQPWWTYCECEGKAKAPADAAVHFISGRIAGDTHRIQATVVSKNSRTTWGAAREGPDPPRTLRSNTIALTNWRRVFVVGDWFVGDTKDLDYPEIARAFRRAAVSVRPAPGLARSDVGLQWQKVYAEICLRAADEGWPFLGDALNANLQEVKLDAAGVTLTYPVRFRPLSLFHQATSARGTLTKARRRIQNFLIARNDHEYRLQCEMHFDTVFDEVARTFPLGRRGLTVLKFACDNKHNATTRDNAAAGFFTEVEGRSARHRAIVFQFTRDANGKVTVHEIGHAMFLAHAPGHSERYREPDGSDADAHDRNGECMMAYNDVADFCGLCLLKLAGCEYRNIGNDGKVVS